MEKALLIGESIVFLEYFRDFPDHRQQGKVHYPLDEASFQLTNRARRPDWGWLRSIWMHFLLAAYI